MLMQLYKVIKFFVSSELLLSFLPFSGFDE